MKTIFLDESATQLGPVIDLALQGEPVFLVKNDKMFLLQEIPPVPISPAAEHASIYDEEYIKESNFLALHSATTLDHDAPE